MAHKLKIAIAAFVIPCQLYAAGWVDNWFDNANIGNGGSYESQKRNHYSAGSFSGRINMGTDRLLTVTPPRISAGCGGIDAFLGGISFLDADYMVEKLENMLQAAPAVAFDMALKTMCKECSETLGKLQAAADVLNSMQLNECAMTKKVVALATKDDPDILGDVWGEINNGASLREGLERSWQESQEKVKANNGSPTTDLRKEVDGCPADFKDVFKTGSILSHAANKIGITEYADLMRGFIGDVVIKANDGDNIPLADKVLACKDNNPKSIDDMLYGNLHKQNLSGVCEKDSDTSLVKLVEDKMTSIANKISSDEGLSQDEIDFINTATSVPVYASLRDGVVKGNVDIKISMMRDLVAVTYAHAMFVDLYSHIDRAFKYVDKVASNPGVDPDAGEKQCRIEVYQQPIAQFRDLHEKLNQYQRLSLASYNNKITELNNALEAAQRLKAEGVEIRRKNALDYQR